MIFAITEEDYVKWLNEPGYNGMFLDCAFMGRTIEEVVGAIKSTVEEWFDETGTIDEPRWRLFDGDLTRKVRIWGERSVTIKWSIEE